jgi:hypothetical protein
MGVSVSAVGRVSAAIIAFTALASCATLNEEQCQTANWYELGQSDGAAGQPASHIDSHRRACAEHNLPVDDTQWSVGWQQGIRSFCTPDNGLTIGREGRYYANSCPPDLKAGFESAYTVAKALHDARQSRDNLMNEIASLESAARDAKTPEDRSRIYSDLDRKQADLRVAERRLWDAEGDYDLYVRTNGLRR